MQSASMIAEVQRANLRLGSLPELPYWRRHVSERTFSILRLSWPTYRFAVMST
jgi:hypothetical protein